MPQTIRASFWRRLILAGNCLSFFSCSVSPDSQQQIIKSTDPFYATYASAKERSSFLLDEGYEWHFYDASEPMEFTTDTGGSLGVLWDINGKPILLVGEMASGPQIIKTYSDMVDYTFNPTEYLKVSSTFFVKSSRHAIWEFLLENTGSLSQEITMKPYIKISGRPFSTIASSDEGIYFTHQEYADGWTQGHNLPHVDSIRNLFAFTDLKKQGAYTQWSADIPAYPYPITHEHEMFRLQGRTYFNGKERNLDQAPLTRIQAFNKKKPEILITENSAVPGMLDPVINQDGYYRLDLGLLGAAEPTDLFVINYYHEGKDLNYRTSVQINSKGTIDRLDAPLANYVGPQIPTNIKLLKDSAGVRLSWRSTLPVHIYRRAYPDSRYYRVGNAITTSSWTDKSKDSNFGYVLTGIMPDGAPGMHSKEYTTIPSSRFLNTTPSAFATEMAKVVSFETNFTLAPGQSKTVRVVRLVQPENEDKEELANASAKLLSEKIEPYRIANQEWVTKLSLGQFENWESKLLYLSAANMMKQVFYPPEEKSSYNYYVFSREPTWGWGHGGQVFHESIAMLAYALIEPKSAMESQMVYEERQYPSGYINYRTGAYLDEIIEYKDTLTSSAPWYAWQNYEIYKITEDRAFLEKMYTSSVKFYTFYVSNRDFDTDGLAEWGGHAILESVRDADVAVWDEVGWPSNFDGVDINSMLVMEAKALEKMAIKLGLTDEAANWKADYVTRSALINKFMWDEETGFYYNIDRKDNDFTFKETDDLKRMEIIGFLPLWAGICNEEQAKKLISHLTDTSKFWRPYGIPSLAADDPYYNNKGYWNGPVWIEWNYLIFHGLKQYRYHKLAKELTQKNARAMIEQLKSNHNLWEFYSPDDPWAGYHKTYIWAGIINRMLVRSK